MTFNEQLQSILETLDHAELTSLNEWIYYRKTALTREASERLALKQVDKK